MLQVMAGRIKYAQPIGQIFHQPSFGCSERNGLATAAGGAMRRQQVEAWRVNTNVLTSRTVYQISFPLNLETKSTMKRVLEESSTRPQVGGGSYATKLPFTLPLLTPLSSLPPPEQGKKRKRVEG